MTLNSYAAEIIRIGVPVGLSGANSVIAPAVVQSSQLAVDEINEAGGIMGRKVVLEIIDDASDANGAQKAFETLISQKKVDAVIAMETSSARNAALPIITRGKLPYIYTSFYEGRSCNKWMYANGWVPEQQVIPMVNFLIQKKTAKTFFLIGSDYSFGRGMLEYTAKYIQKSGGSVLGEEYISISSSDWSAVISKIKTVKPDALISATAGGIPNVTFAKQLRAAGITLPYGNLAIDEGTAKSMGSLATGIIFSASYLMAIESIENRRFLMRLLVRFGVDAKPPNELSVPQYEAFFLYKAAVERAQTTDSEKVIEALSEVSFTGPRGRVQMNRSRHTPLSMRLAQMRSDGTIRILETYANIDPGVQCVLAQ